MSNYVLTTEFDRPRHLAIVSVTINPTQIMLKQCTQIHGGVSISTTDRPTRRRIILLWTNNMGGWSVARSDSPSLLVKHPRLYEKKKEFHWK